MKNELLKDMMVKPKTHLYTVDWYVFTMLTERDFGHSRSKKFLTKESAQKFRDEINKAYMLIFDKENGYAATIIEEEIEV